MAETFSGANRAWRGVVAGAAALAGMMLPAAPSIAYEGNSWLQFGPVSDSNTFTYNSNSYDRNFVREWEANPPRGYPTLSPANIDATKQAIKRYEKIVADGGWKPLAQKELQSGMSGQVIGDLSARLRMSGHLREEGLFPEHFGQEVEQAVKRPGGGAAHLPVIEPDIAQRAARR